jgi:uncharacterized protein with PIN domain
MSSIRFYLDENIASAIARGLRHRNIDVLTTHEAGNRGADDERQLNFAHSEKRVPVTQDDDLLRLASTGIAHSGIVYYHPQTRTIKEILNGLMLIYQILLPADMQNQIEYI